MAQRAATQEQGYLEAFEALERNGYARDPSWVRALRQEAMARFQELGFPTDRRGNEEWKYTDVNPIARAHFQTVPQKTSQRITAEQLNRFTFGETTWSRLVFVDGDYAPSLSALSPLPSGATVSSLSEAMTAQAGLLEEHLARHTDYQGHAFSALNTAFVHDGAFVYIPDGAVMEQPIHLLFLATGDGSTSVSHPRVLVLAGMESKATIIESYADLLGGQCFTNAVTEVVVGAGAAVQQYRFQRYGEEAFHVGTTEAVLRQDSSFLSVASDLGGKLVRNNLNVLMGETGASCTLNGLYLTTGSEHVDNQVLIDHAGSFTTSRELYKGVLDDQSRAVFHGSIVVQKGVQKADARQEDKNLLLSAQAEVDSKPAFWIYADDVRCSHGAACGQLDEDALFYLQSRGVGEKEARSILVRGFVNEVIESIPNQRLRAHLDDLVETRLRKM